MHDKDLFLSYSSKDRVFAERLASDLTQSGVRVWWDQGEMKVGDSLNTKIQQGILGSRWLGIVLSPNSIASVWVERELNAGLIRELAQNEVIVLPLLYANCDIPVFLKDKIYADFSVDYAQGLAQLLDRVVSADAKVVIELLGDDEERIRFAFAGIVESRRDEYLNILRNALLDVSTDHGRRLAALTALFTVRSPGLGAHLVGLAKAGPASMRRRALFYLGEMKARSAAPVVTFCLSDANPHIRAEARAAYKKLSE
jgi:hypothetical protein